MDSDRSAQLGQGSIPRLLLRFSGRHRGHDGPSPVQSHRPRLYRPGDGQRRHCRHRRRFPLHAHRAGLRHAHRFRGHGPDLHPARRAAKGRRRTDPRQCDRAVGHCLPPDYRGGFAPVGPDLEGFRRQWRRVAICPGLSANHRSGHHLSDLRVWPECGDPRRGQPPHRHAFHADQRGAQRDPRRRSSSSASIGA